MTPDQLEQISCTLTKQEILNFLMDKQLLKKEVFCLCCNQPQKLVKHTRTIDFYAWRCMTRTCTAYKTCKSVRSCSFFDGFRVDLKIIIRIISKYCSRQPLYSIKNAIDGVSKCVVEKVIAKLVSYMPEPDFSENKLGGPGKIVQIDETMLNFKCKSHRGRSSSNRTDSLCIVEVSERITKAFAVVIPDKRATTLLPIICRQVAANSVIYTDEHRSYTGLSSLNFEHSSVCHKYEFVNNVTGVNTQAVESFNSELKREIKKRKGVLTNNRSVFLKEFCFCFNNKVGFTSVVINLIKV